MNDPEGSAGEVIGMWSIPVKDLLDALHRAGGPLPDWTDDAVVIHARADEHGVTLVGYA